MARSLSVRHNREYLYPRKRRFYFHGSRKIPFNITKKRRSKTVFFLAPRVGFEPTTLRLTAGCSTAELTRNMKCGNYLSSRVVSDRVLSAQLSLTSVFGMRTGGTSTLSSPQWLYNCLSTDNILNIIRRISTA